MAAYSHRIYDAQPASREHPVVSAKRQRWQQKIRCPTVVSHARKAGSEADSGLRAISDSLLLSPSDDYRRKQPDLLSLLKGNWPRFIQPTHRHKQPRA